MPSRVCRVVDTIFGSQAILKGCLPLELLVCIPTKWNQTINSGFRMMVFYSHTNRETNRQGSQCHVCGGNRLPVLASKSFSKNNFSRVVIRAHSLFKPVVLLLFSAIRSPRGPLGPLSRLGLRFVVVVVLGDQISTGAPRICVLAGAEICCGCCCSRRSDLHGGPSGPCRGWG